MQSGVDTRKLHAYQSFTYNWKWTTNLTPSTKKEDEKTTRRGQESSQAGPIIQIKTKFVSNGTSLPNLISLIILLACFPQKATWTSGLGHDRLTK